MALIPKKNLDFWIENNLNVLLTGHAGCGKTATILEAFQKHNLKYQYYSCSTLDPYVDFIGVPREVEDPKTGMKVLDLVRPKQWACDEIEALFLDEYNRSKTAVRNAVMELIQFKSINGKKFNKLKIVWAAINPEESSDDSNVSYDVEPLDPAQKDRFHIHYDVPYQPDMEYFSKKYGSAKAKLAIEWWRSLDKNTKMIVSPRRLDYAVEVHGLDGDISFVVPKLANPDALKRKLGSISVVEKIDMFLTNVFTDTDAIKEFFQSETNYHYGIDHILENSKSWQKLLPCLPEEKFNALFVAKTNDKVVRHVIFNPLTFNKFFDSTAKLSKDSSLKKFVISNIQKLSTDFDLKEKFGLNPQKTQPVTVPTTTAIIGGISATINKAQLDYIEAAIKLMGRGRHGRFGRTGQITTPEKKQLIMRYLKTFGSDGIAIRENYLLEKEAEFLMAIAKRMQRETFRCLLNLESAIPRPHPSIPKYVNVNVYFKQTKTFIMASPGIGVLADHFAPIFNLPA